MYMKALESSGLHSTSTTCWMCKHNLWIC